MVIAYISGGLGNQMFEYAMARRLAHHRNVELKLDLIEYQRGADNRPTGLDDFRRKVGLYKLSVTAAEASQSEIELLRDPYAKKTTAGRIVRRIRRIKPGFLKPSTHYKEKHFRFDATPMDLPGDVYLEGFWQSEKYFSEIAPAIRTEFAPKDPAISAYAKDYVAKLRSLGGPIISVHVRRGDLASAYEKLDQPGAKPAADLVSYTQFWGKPISLEYINAAMSRFGPTGRFLVFSDTAKDIAWCKEHIHADQLHFSEGHNDIQDMAIMSSCDHHIIANSTFSWWSAWLNPSPTKRVIAPSKWSNAEMVPDDLVPPAWEMI